MIVIYYYELKADPEHIIVIGWEKEIYQWEESLLLAGTKYATAFSDLSGKGNINVLRTREQS